jgi:hypothetical protein
MLSNAKRLLKEICPSYEYVEWDCFVWSKTLNLIGFDQDIKSANNYVLDIGSRDLSLAYSLRAYSNINVISSDYMPLSTEGRRRQTLFDLKFKRLDIKNNVILEEIYDIIYVKSVLGSACKTEDELRQAVNFLADNVGPKGRVYIIENMYVSDFHQFMRSNLVKWGTSWNYWRYDEIVSILKERFHISVQRRYGVLSWMVPERFRKMVWPIELVVNVFTPDKYKYVLGLKLTKK